MAESVQISDDGTLRASGSGRTIRDIKLTGGLTIAGEIATGTAPSNTPFGGFENEDTSFAGGQLSISTGAPALVVTSGYPRYQLPATGTTGLLTPPMNFPVWYKNVDIHLGVSNDHSATGNVRVRFILREVDIGQALSAAGSLSDVTVTLAAPGINGGVGIFQPVTSVALTPGFFGSIYSCEIQRLGDDGADTLAGPLGILAFGFSRIDP